MKAKVISVGKDTLPRFNADTGQDEPTVMVVVEVEFYNDDGTPFEAHPTQTYALTPEDANPEYFQSQADVMQNELNMAAANAVLTQQLSLADEKVAQISALIETPNEIPQP